MSIYCIVCLSIHAFLQFFTKYLNKDKFCANEPFKQIFSTVFTPTNWNPFQKVSGHLQHIYSSLQCSLSASLTPELVAPEPEIHLGVVFSTLQDTPCYIYSIAHLHV